MDNWGKDDTMDELHEYLRLPPIHNLENPIQYWSGMLKGGSLLAQMALDFLSAPGMYYKHLNFIVLISIV